MPAEPIYSDINQRDPHLRDALLVDAKAIFQSIRNILNTTREFRLFNPYLGNRIEDILFRPEGETTASLLFREVVLAIQRDEDRVTLDTSRSDVSFNRSRQRYDVDLYFTVLGLGDQVFNYTGALDRRSVL